MGRELKRIFDLTLSIFFIVLLSPIIIIVSVAIIILDGKPIIFKQDRLGIDHTPFRIIKFRTMTRERDEEGNLLPDKNRTTRMGNFMRKTSIDELPSLLNVLKGELSIIGPRPLRARYLDRYSPEQDRRHEVKPGITGWAQVNGRNAISWKKRFELDVWYVDNQSLFLDMKILFLTIYVILFRKDINVSENDTMEEFRGSGY